MSTEAKRVWIDMDNSPHVPFFRPIIDELRARGCSVTLTARDAFQVSELTKLHRIQCKAVGRHYGKNRAMKVLGLAVRALQLVPLALRDRPDLAVSHGSRAQMLAAKLLGIPSVLIADYEHVRHVIRPDWVILPEVVPTPGSGKLAQRTLKYPGIKEDVYVPNFQPDPAILEQLGVAERDILVTVRPPATEAHYHNPESEKLFAAVMERLGAADGVRVVLLPRNDRQAGEIRREWSRWLENGKMIIPERAVDGLNLVWYSDLVISGGGTMNREAAALGVPVYSIFRGRIGAVDRYLAQNGRLVLVETVDDVHQKIALIKRDRAGSREFTDRSALHSVVQGIATALNSH